jgi:hypothetical protein
MAIQTIDIGNVVNDGLGDDLRTAFQKVNANFSSLATEMLITVGNATNTGESLFKEKNGSTLEFKTLLAGAGIGLNTTPNTITINNTATAFKSFITESGNIFAGQGNPQQITLEGITAPGSTTGRKDIEVTSNGTDHVYFKTVIPVTDILTSYDFGPLTGNFDNAMQLVFTATTIDFGTLSVPGTLNLDCGPLLGN